MFSKSVADKLQYYVYRLIDPRNGEAFYVGKGERKGQLHSESRVGARSR